MGTFLDDLDDHEGYADRRLPDGQLAGGVWTYATREFTAYVAACGCGWQATGEHPPTEEGEEAAVDQWRSEHAEPELARQATRRRGEPGLDAASGWAARPTGWRTPPPWSASAAPWTVPAQLVDDLQRDLEREASEREDRGER